MNVRLAIGVLAIAAPALLVGCAASSSPSATPASSTSPAKPDRIISLSPTVTEDLYAVGAGSQVVAVDSDSNYPTYAPKTSLSGLSPNLEAIAKYRPDLVVASQNTGGLVSGLTKLGIRVLIEPAATNVDGVYAQIDQIGNVTGHHAQAQHKVTLMKSQIAADVEQAGSSHRDLTYYWELSAKPYYSATSQTFIGQVVGLFGLKNIADAANKASDGGYPELSQEYIVAASPQIIFLADNQAADGGQSPAVVARRPGWTVVPAVKDNEIIGLNDDIASRWGPRLPQLVAQIAQAVDRAGA